MQPQPYKTDGPFGQIPNYVTRDLGIDDYLGAAELALVAYRVTFVGPFGLNAGNCRGAFSAGMGRDVFESTVAKLRKRGLIQRTQSVRDGRFDYARDGLIFSPYANYRIAWRWWFDGKLTVKEISALVVVRASWSNGLRSKELAARFGWSDKLAGQVARSLVNRELLVAVPCRSKRTGRALEIRYVDAETHRSKIRARDQPSISRARKTRAHTYGTTFTDSTDGTRCSDVPATFCETESNLVSALPAEARAQKGLSMIEQAYADDCLLGWTRRGAGKPWEIPIDHDGVYALALETYDIADDDSLADAIREVTRNGAATHLLAPAGLYAFRLLAVSVLADAPDEVDLDDVREALLGLLKALAVRIGAQSDRIQSWRLLGERLAGTIYSGGDEAFYARGRR